MPLTKKQRVFVDEYVQCWNATEAARKAGYSERSARVIGCENLTKPDIKAYYEQRLNEITMSAEECLAELADLARGDTPAKLQALAWIGKAHSLFVERQQVEMEHSLSDKLSGQISDALSRGYDDESD